jgi:hypothetical protein
MQAGFAAPYMTQMRYLIDRKRKFGYLSGVVNAAAVFACQAGPQHNSLARVLREA